ncbi:MAG: hypothetical protein ACR2QM_17865 [Longimicrobiales bacterium]
MTSSDTPEGPGADPDLYDSQGAETGALRRNAFPIAVIVVFAVIGCLLGPQVAPNLAPWRTCLGGVILGAFSGGAAVLNRLLE